MKGKIAVFGLVILLALPALAWSADVAGEWIAKAPGNQGDVEITLNFKVEGTNLTGTLDNPQAGPADIKNGKVEGDAISFHIVRKFGENEMKIVSVLRHMNSPSSR